MFCQQLKAAALVLAFGLILGLTCASANATELKKFSMETGASLTFYDLAETPVIITLHSIEDSRCPKGAHCVWAGEYYKTVSAQYNNQTAKAKICCDAFSAPDGKDFVMCQSAKKAALFVPQLNYKITCGTQHGALKISEAENKPDQSEQPEKPNKKSLLLQQGKTVAIDDMGETPFKLTLVKSDNSRCPPNAHCEWAGALELTLRAQSATDSVTEKICCDGTTEPSGRFVSQCLTTQYNALALPGTGLVAKCGKDINEVIIVPQ